MDLLAPKADLVRQVVLINCLRATAALLVFFAHADASYWVYIPIITAYKAQLGEIGVYIFFVLSGFLIWSSASHYIETPSGRATYVIHRITRIGPLYFVNVAYCVFIAASISTFTPEVSEYTVLRHLTFTQSLIPSVSQALNPVLWTLTHEALFYAIVPFVFLIRRHDVAIVVSSLALHRLAVTFPGMTFSPFLYYLPLFAFGIAFAETARSPSMWLAALLTGSCFVVPGPYLTATIALTVVAAICAARTLPIWHSWPVLAISFVGVISYSFYIWHWLILEIPAIRVFASQHLPLIYQQPVLRGVTFTGFVLLISALSYWAIEAPAMGPLRRSLERTLRVRKTLARKASLAP